MTVSGGIDLPTGTVTFLFTDIEGSTRLVAELGEAWPPLLEEHNRVLREAIRGADGIDLRTEGDSFFAVFRTASASVVAAAAAQQALAEYRWPTAAPIRVRMGMPGSPLPATAARCCFRRPQPS
jgi:class 3 adenylate cyclase